jgi:hypothetical protein
MKIGSKGVVGWMLSYAVFHHLTNNTAQAHARTAAAAGAAAAGGGGASRGGAASDLSSID